MPPTPSLFIYTASFCSFHYITNTFVNSFISPLAFPFLLSVLNLSWKQNNAVSLTKETRQHEQKEPSIHLESTAISCLHVL